MAKGRTPRPIRFDDDQWHAAVAAFPADLGRKGGVSAEVQGFIEFLGTRPDVWRAVKAQADMLGLDPWQFVEDAVAAYEP